MGPATSGLMGGYRLLSPLTKTPIEADSVEAGTLAGAGHRTFSGALVGQSPLEDGGHLRIKGLEGPLRDRLT